MSANKENNESILRIPMNIIFAVVAIEIMYLVAEDVLRKVSPATYLPDIGWLIVAILAIGVSAIYYKVKR